MSLEDLGLELAVRLYQFVNVVVLLVFLVGLAIWARSRVTRSLKRAGSDASPGNVSGADLARSMLNATGLDRDISPVVVIRGPLATYYDFGRRELRLAGRVAHGASPIHQGLAAHEVGHAIQQAQGYYPARLRTPLVIASGLGSRVAWMVLVAACVFNHPELAMRGAWLLAGSTLAALLLLPIEADANRRARLLLAGAAADDPALEPRMAAALDAARWDHLAATLPWSTQPASESLLRLEDSVLTSPQRLNAHPD